MHKTQILILIALLSISCDSSSPAEKERILVCTQDPVPRVLMPLEVGNFWDLVAQRHDGTVVDTLRTIITTKLSPEKYGIEGAFVAEEYNFSDPLNVWRKLIWKNEPDGLLLAGLIRDADTVITNFRKYPFPATSGDTFYSYVVDSSNVPGELVRVDSTEWSVFSVGHLVSTPVREFSTVVFKYYRESPLFDVSGDNIYEQVAPGIGVVARDWEYLDGFHTFIPDFTHRLVGLCIRQPEN